MQIYGAARSGVSMALAALITAYITTRRNRKVLVLLPFRDFTTPYSPLFSYFLDMLPTREDHDSFPKKRIITAHDCTVTFEGKIRFTDEHFDWVIMHDYPQRYQPTYDVHTLAFWYEHLPTLYITSRHDTIIFPDWPRA